VTRRLASLSLFLLAAAVAGVGLAEERPGSPAKRYLLLLREDGRYEAPRGDALGKRIEEYRQWSRSTAGVESGDKLAGSGWRLSGREASAFAIDPKLGFVAGLFVVSASSDAEALRIARTCPHLSHGGEIELRPIE
jgi:hypothetical protein